MYTEFRSLLAKAKGESELVMVANADIRGFSKFSLERESVEAALFVKKVYMALLTDYFAYVDFYKPTGDGLLMVFLVEEETLAEQSNRLVEDSLRLVREFSGILRDDPIINFRVPEKIGIGLARGAASRLVSGKRTLDYSGRILNLASRLMDVARPAGVVLDESFGFDLLSAEVAAEFSEGSIYVRSVAERQPLRIHYTHEHTEIPATAHRPIDEPEWREQTMELTVREIADLDSSGFWLALDQQPLDPTAISVAAWHPKVTASGRRDPANLRLAPVEFRYLEDAGRPIVAWNPRELSTLLRARGVKATWKVQIIATYCV